MQLTSMYIVGGQQRNTTLIDKKEGYRFKQGLIIRLDPEKEVVDICVEYTTPPAICPPDNHSILFKAGAIQDHKLYVCTGTEVLSYQIPHFQQISYLSLPCFNDLHHVQPTPQGNLFVAVTGLDMVVEVTPEGEILREWGVLNGQTPWERFSRNVDYRRIASTKPHQAHPNYVFMVGEDIWVTRFEQKDAVCLTQLDQRINIGVERPHDGVIHKENVYFTTVDGHIVVANLDDFQIKQVTDLNKITNFNGALGWCRGLLVLDRDHVIVGFSRLRSTKFHQNISWVKNRLTGQKTIKTLPTRITLYNLKRRELCWEYNLEDIGMNVVFSIHSALGNS